MFSEWPRYITLATKERTVRSIAADLRSFGVGRRDTHGGETAASR